MFPLLSMVFLSLSVSPCRPELPKSLPLPSDARVDSIVVIKHKREMHVYQRQKLLKTYLVALGQNPVGPKQYQGDLKTPEGLYRIHIKNAQSIAHKSLGISYPSEKDRINAKRLGKNPGGDIMIHGLPNGQGYIGGEHRNSDWTWGCVAVTDEEIDELFAHTAVGARVNILP